MRIGNGYDVHRLVPGRQLILGGVDIPNKLGLLGHSDADVLVHAIMDALFGALALGDIGQHFPDSDASFKGISSLLLLKETATIIEKNDYKVVNIDSTIVAQKPKLAPYIIEMRQNIAQCIGVSIDCVGVKATTTEGLGFVGRGDGIAAYAVVLLEKNNSSKT